MSLELVIDRRASTCLGCLLNDGRLVEVALEEGQGGFQDRIFLGRVRAVEGAMEAAFVDCGEGEPAMLGARGARFVSGAERGTPIGRQLSEGQAILVQGRRESGQGKGPRVTGDIALGGLCLVLRPRRADLLLSARLGRAPDAQAEFARAQKLFPEGGLLLRSAAREATDSELLEEATRLRALWAEIEGRARDVRAPATLHDAGTPLERVLTRLAGPRLERILFGEQSALLQARRCLGRSWPGLAERLELVPDALGASGVSEQLEQALAPVVPLAGGGSLIVEPTAALTAIDVNGAGRGALETNLAAAGEIARQVRLRRLGGTIVIDFVDLASRRDRARVHSALRLAFDQDPMPVQIAPMSAFGLVAISRSRPSPTLAEQLSRACPACEGNGWLWSLTWQSEALVAALETHAGLDLQVRLAPDLHRHLEGGEADAWRDFLARARAPVRLLADPSLSPGSYVIEQQAKPP